MATRINRKNATTSVSKEVVATDKSSNKNEPATETSPKASPGGKTAAVKTTSLAKKLAKKNPPKKILKKPSIAIKLKAKSKKAVKLNPKLAKTILQNTKTLENRKKLLKNGVKEVKPKKRKTAVKKDKDDSPPVLEPIYPIEENVENKKQQPKKRLTKKALKASTDLLDAKKIKIENEDTLSVASDVTDNSNEIPHLPKQVRKPRALKKPKVEKETLEDVMNDLSFLIKDEKEEIKKEVDSLSESGKSDTTTKPKKLTKRQRIELLKKKIIKKENIENTLSKLDSSDEKVIDMLDLNVGKVKKKSPLTKRRHSIEKFPISNMDTTDTAIPQLSLFNQLPRSISPRSKRNTKVRQSIDGINRRSSPYSTRSDSPARMLRNGKQRKLKDMNLLEGLDSDVRKRRRLCSDLSGSEMSVSRSGYESDSSFSDIASMIGGDINDPKDLEAKSTPKEDTDIYPEGATPPVVEQPSPPLEITTNGLIDTNSNVCNNLNPVDINLNDKEMTKQPLEDSSLYPIGPSMKVPEKSIILDIMKQTFNDVSDDKVAKKINQKPNFEIETVLVSKFYGKSETPTPEETTDSTLAPIEIETILPEAQSEVEPPTLVPAEEKVTDEIEETSDKLIETEAQLEAEAEGTAMEVESDELNLADLQQPVLEPAVCEEPAEEMETEDKVTVEEEKYEESVMENGETEVDVPEQEQLERTVNEPVLEALVKEVIDESGDKSGEMPVLQIESVVNALGEEATEERQLEASDNADLTELSKAIAMEGVEEGEAVQQDLQESAEELAQKESVLKALGLQSLKAAEEAKQKTKGKPVSKSDKNSYTGTLKTVIKLNRDKKKGRLKNSLKMTLQKKKRKSSEGEHGGSEENNYKIMKDGASTAWKHGNHSSDTAGAHRKSHYSNRSNMDGSSEHTSDGEAVAQDSAIKALVIPEKASSFEFHPDRLCKDECSYCFGKFGMFDTPMHIAQLKSTERQNKILAIEKHLMRDSCLCDACYRHVDRKANTPSYRNKSLKRNSLVAPGPRQNHCHVLGCNQESTTIVKRKWFLKMKKNICQVINIDLDNPGLHSIPICDEHFAALEYLMVCALCKRKLARSHIHYLGPESNGLNNALQDMGIPVEVPERPVVCRLCKSFAQGILMDPEKRPENSEKFFNEYKRRILHFNKIVPMNEAEAEEPLAVPNKSDQSKEQIKKKSKKNSKRRSQGESSSQVDGQESNESPEKIHERVPSTDTNSQPQSGSESPSDEYNSVDYNTLIPTIAMDCGSDTEGKKEARKPPIVIKKIGPRIDSGKDAVEISKVIKPAIDKTKNSDIVVARLGSNPSISVRQLFPGEEDLPLNSNIEFHNVKDRTPEGWEKCTSTIQYDAETKRLWQELQKPYGNQSSFLRHLILLEKYFRNGDLVLSSKASRHSENYCESVQNRLRAYDNIPPSAGNIQPISMIPFNKMQKSSSGIITSTIVSTSSASTSTSSNSSSLNIPLTHSPAVSVTTIPSNSQKNAPLTLSQLNSPPLIPANAVLQQVRPKMVGAPPGLISLHPGTSRPVAPLVKVPQSQKIKFPITKNWRPNLIPIDPTKKQERKAGLVQVISGGKPYHITLEDYKKMCAIKRSFEMKQKRLQEAQNAKPILVTHNSVLKSIIPRKGLIISKTATVSAPAKNETITPQNDTNGDSENILDKLDKQVEKLESKLNEKSSALLLPKIPKSLTVIPQTVTKKPSRPSSPALLITPKSTNKS